MKGPPKLNPLRLTVDPAAQTPLWQQLSVGLRAAIADGQMRPAARLPSSRELARRLNVSRNTVTAAYDDLASRGLLLGRIGAGSFVDAAPIGRSRPSVWFQDDSGNRLALCQLP
jgi:DNA-binding GntR family transcriptional regulator